MIFFSQGGKVFAVCCIDVTVVAEFLLF